MKRALIFLLLASLLQAGSAACTTAGKVEPTPTPSPMDAVGKLHWFGTSAFLYNGSKIIYFDPVTLAGTLPPADLILITHAHSDHWSVADIKQIIGPNTVLVIGTNGSVAYEAAKADLGIPATILGEGMQTEIGGVSIAAVPAYDTTFHLKGTGGVGFLVTVDGITFYHTGGTAAYPDMAKYNCDIAFIPMYTREQAQAIAEILPAKVIIPEHTSYYGAKALADLLTQSMGENKKFLALQSGPYQP
jgi:L-ascorbate metabolism protein UlaG (beta-lactamase superfamily)